MEPIFTADPIDRIITRWDDVSADWVIYETYATKEAMNTAIEELEAQGIAVGYHNKYNDISTGDALRLGEEDKCLLDEAFADGFRYAELQVPYDPSQYVLFAVFRAEKHLREKIEEDCIIAVANNETGEWTVSALTWRKQGI